MSSTGRTSGSVPFKCVVIVISVLLTILLGYIITPVWLSTSLASLWERAAMVWINELEVADFLADCLF